MTNEAKTVTEYLRGLRCGEINTPRPFDKSGVAVELGPVAQAFELPLLTLDEIMPPSSETVAKVYALLRPVYEEIATDQCFISDASYGKVTASDVAKGYLFNAINRKLPAMTPEVLAVQVFMRHVTDALVMGIEPEEAVDHFHKQGNAAKQVDNILNCVSIECWMKAEVAQKYQDSGRFNLAYFTKIIPDDVYYHGLAEKLKEPLLMALESYRGKKSKRNSPRAFLGKKSKETLSVDEMKAMIDGIDNFVTGLRVLSQLSTSLDLYAENSMATVMLDTLKQTYLPLSQVIPAFNPKDQEQVKDAMKCFRMSLAKQLRVAAQKAEFNEIISLDSSSDHDSSCDSPRYS